MLRTIPSGVFQDHCLNLIGNGVVIDRCCSDSIVFP
ncbi:MAG: adenylosuccinate synthetase [Chitinophagaceae bacterium]